jgi:putative NADPH-quinone reductase
MKEKKKIFILMGNPDMDSLTNKLADEYQSGAIMGGHEVRRLNLPEMRFDPILHRGYKAIQELEPDLKAFQENVRWCDHFVVLYPNWWCTMPALLKGLIDRAWIPGFAFHMVKGSSWRWTAQLKGKSARTFILANVHPWITWFLFGEFTNELGRATLGFSGMHPIRIKIFSPSEKATDQKRARWMAQVRRMGARAE